MTKAVTVESAEPTTRAAHDPDTTKGSNRRHPAPLLRVIQDAVLPLAIYLYFTGFMYVYSLYNDLGIGLGGVDIPVYYFFIYSTNVFRAYLRVLTLALLAIFLAVGFLPKW